MFTGLIQGVGTLAAREPRGSDARLRIHTGSFPFTDPMAGESIAVNGVCLTMVDFDAEGFEADISPVTLALTTLGVLPPGSGLNLERALRADDRLGGHMVSGHVDGIGQVLGICDDDGGAQRWKFGAPRALLRYVARKGSICVDGVSLTVNAVDDHGFEVTLVPHTISHTTFARTAAGDAVNLEVDLVARHVERLLSTQEAS